MSSAAVSSSRSRQASGREVIHVSAKASERHSTTVSPRVLSEMRSVLKQMATLPVAKPPRATVQRGMAAISAAPDVSAKSSQALGMVAHTASWEGVGVAVLQTALPVTVLVPESKPKAIRKHSTMLAPSDDEVMDPVARHVAALPAANGPRATVQTATSAISSKPFESSRLVHSSGRVVIHLPSRAVKMQSAISDPTVVSEMLVARHVAMLPAAYGPRATVQEAITGIRARPLVVSRLAQLAGSATSQKEDVEVADATHSDTDVVTGSVVVGVTVVEVVDSSAVVDSLSEEAVVDSTAPVVV